ncbi:MAG: Gfo/Idh/MocA family oxidoreductase [Gloeobacteraceae cyanobacterium ES-bin-144]|nr:Gfo/Idh/MocA family oxidoreductase [Verrucomicrobiales bacterium]
MRIMISVIIGLTTLPLYSDLEKPPLPIAIIGLVHSHVGGFLPNVLASSEVQLVGIVEPDPQLVAKCAKNYKLSTELFFPTIEELLAKTNVKAVATFTSTFDHRRVVEACAPKGIHVMMEKPLAVNMEHARAMAAAAKKGNVHLLINYETTWYPSNHAAYQIAHEQKAIGALRKLVVHDGHRGPIEIGCPPEFLAWLTDPILNGGGALTDFGCYGANLMTWLMDGQRPTSVVAVTQTIKPNLYPKVDDEATIVVTYPEAQGVIQASWNWPYHRKDMEIYGQNGYVLVPRKNQLRGLLGEQPEKETIVPPMSGPEADPLSYLAAVVRGEIKPSGLSSLEVNMIVTEILDAARESAATGKRVDLPQIPQGN